MSQAPAMKGRRWVAQGRVQGVGFRWFIQGRAQGMGIRGWVRNLPDGSVEVVGVAAAGQLEAFEPVIRRGPPGASVTLLTSEDVPHEAVDTNSFIIKR